MVSTRPVIFKSSRTFTNPLVIVPRARITICIIFTFMFPNFFNSLTRSRCFIIIYSFRVFHVIIFRCSSSIVQKTKTNLISVFKKLMKHECDSDTHRGWRFPFLVSSRHFSVQSQQESLKISMLLIFSYFYFPVFFLFLFFFSLCSCCQRC